MGKNAKLGLISWLKAHIINVLYQNIAFYFILCLAVYVLSVQSMPYDTTIRKYQNRKFSRKQGDNGKNNYNSVEGYATVPF